MHTPPTHPPTGRQAGSQGSKEAHSAWRTCVVLNALGSPSKVASGALNLRTSQTRSVSSAPRDSSVAPSREKARDVISLPARPGAARLLLEDPHMMLEMYGYRRQM